MQSYIVEITQQQIFRVEVLAESPQQAIELVHNQRGDVVLELPPEIVASASKLIEQE